MAESSSAFAYLNDLAQRAINVQQHLPSRHEKVEPMWNGVGFRMAGHNFVVPMSDLSEVVLEPSVTRLPGVKPWVRGVANIRGRLLPLVDLVAFLGLESQVGVQRRVLVYERGDIYIGLLVDEVLGMQYFKQASYSESSEADNPDAILRFTQGSYRQETQVWSVFRLVRLLDDTDFFNVAA